ncbi:hypothetical protein BSLG_002988 [Batrachochytrium salamandrivorans]|nr:hypothetical protein BSLG_002988 [Batrachochytrium salamandrivorans]
MNTFLPTYDPTPPAHRPEAQCGSSILKHWNSNLASRLVQVAKYFANARTAEDPLMTDIDCADFHSPGASLNEKEFTMPPPLHFIYAAIGWAILYSMAYVDTVPATLNLSVALLVATNHAQTYFAIFIIHAIEAVATVAIGIWAEFTLSNILKWWFLTHIFGFATLGPVVRIAFRRRADLDAKDDIQ